MKNIILAATLFLAFYQAKAQEGIGVPNPDQSAILELSSSRQGFLPPRLTTAERDAIASPAVGLMIFNTTKNCLEWKLVAGWYNACGDNGPGVVTNYTCNTAMTGVMTARVPVSGVSQTITANVTATGSYNISAVSNGVTFSGRGNFTSLGPNQVVLTATGTPTAMGEHEFILNTGGPASCSFRRTTNVPEAIVAGYTCNTASAGAMMVGTAVIGVTQTITANVTATGTYNIRAAINGVTFAASGTFAATGAQNVVLTATGTPTVAGNNNFVIDGTPTCTFTRNIDRIPGTVTGPDGRVWMAYNLGATDTATSIRDAAQYGDLYQWGRGADGHQIRTSATTTTRSTGDDPGHGSFIRFAGNWRTTSNNNLWQGAAGINNPCPTGFRLPNYGELLNLRDLIIRPGASENPGQRMYNSTLKFPLPGFRDNASGALRDVGSWTYIWGSETTSGRSYSIFHSTDSFGSGSLERGYGATVRCIRN